MSNTWKRLLSLLLAVVMMLSLGVTGFADDGEEETPAETPEENEVLDPEEPAEEPDGGDLEMIEISPDKLNIRKLGLEEPEEDGEELISADEVDLNQVVRVSIFLDTPSTLGAGFSADGVGTNPAAIAYRDGLKAQQNDLTAQIESAIGHPLDVQWNLTLAVNAISAYVTLGDIVKIEKVPGVKCVQRENQYLPMDDETADPNTANTSENMVGATAAWAAGYTGAGSRIAIIDTGIDTTHQSFAEEPFTYSVGQVNATDELMTQAQVEALAGQLNSGSGNYVSAKIPYGYNYVDKNTTIDHMSDDSGEHGSHVAGIAAANRFIGTAHNDAAETVGAVGMAPDAQLFVMKVFGAKGGAYDSDYMVAIEDAIVLGCDVANLSLGSGVQGWTFDNTYQSMIMNWANGEHNGKMVLSISAGNAYDLAYLMSNEYLYIEDVDMHTGGSPGTFLNSLCVAAAQNTLTKGTPMEFDGSLDVNYYESTGNEKEGTTYTNPALTTIAGSYSYVYIDAAGTPEDYSAVNSAVGLSGKVVLVNRGDIPFVDKGENAKSYNPKAVIIANNKIGVIYMDLTNFTGTFPMVTITQKDAEKIKEGGTEHTTGSGVTYYTGTVKVTDVEKEVTIDRSQATITDFSSWGVPGSLIMKPEITAPGGDIYSVNGTHAGEANNPGGSDQYELMSGTSMAAPHITGLTAVLAEYQRENDLVALNPGLSSYSTRAIAQSLMMSTATPMMPENSYLPVLQQGAGLADVYRAVNSHSVIMMDPSNSGLTGKTGAADDGKVKVELGDDPGREGDYSFRFTVYNLSDEDLHFNVDTDMFTQEVLERDGEFLMGRGTVGIGASATFKWDPIEGSAPVENKHDVNRDGKTDQADAQDLLNIITYEVDAADFGWEDETDPALLAVADMDGDEMLTSYDAYLLLGDLPEESEGYGDGVVPAHGSRSCSVRITLPDSVKEDLDLNYPCGAYLEGFTYVTCDTTNEEGAVYEDEHSIPILGFYGSWTDPSMFDTAPYTEKLYGSTQENYSGATTTNYLLLQMNGANVKFSGNPYMVENAFPSDRLAINSSTAMVLIAYNLVRAAGTTGFAVTRLDGEHQVTEVISSAVTGNQVTGMWYSPSGGWKGLTMKPYGINKTPADYSLTEGDRFRVGFYAIPEYNAMLVKNDYTGADAGILDMDEEEDRELFNTLLTSNALGRGAYVGFDFVVDDTAPVITGASLDGTDLTITASDNQALAYVAVLSLDGTVIYSEDAPGEAAYIDTIDAAEAVANAKGYVAVFAGDYAGNETAVAVNVNDDCYEDKTVYVLTDTLTAGDEYLIVNTNSTGSGFALGHSGTAIATNAVTVRDGISETDNKVYIDSLDVSGTSVWTVASGYTFKNDNYYLRRNSSSGTNLQAGTGNQYNTWNWDGANNRLSVDIRSGFSTRTYYLRYANSTFSLNTATNSVYLFHKTTIRAEIDPYGVTEVTITPETLDLYKGNTADLTAKVLPLTAADRTVSWSSSNTGVATVDAYGKVTAVAAGTATIRATANGDPTRYGECTVTVTAINKTLSGIVWDEEGKIWFSSFNANNLPTWTKSSNNAVAHELTNAFMFSNTKLYATTCDLSDTSVIYSVNRSSYALTEFGSNYVPAFGMARSMTGFQSQGYNFIVYGFAGNLVFGNLDPDYIDPKDSTSAMYSGLPYGLIDLSETAVGDAYVCAVCARTIDSTTCSYYFLDETGKIWQITLNYDTSVPEDESPFVFSTPTLVVDTGIGTSFVYQSLYYDGTNIYWSHTTDEDCQLIIYVPSTGKLYNAGNFGADVWPVAGLYVNGVAAPGTTGSNSVGDELMGEPIHLQRVATREDLLTENVLARFLSYGYDLSFLLPQETEEPEEEPVEEPIEEPEEEPVEDPVPIEEPIEEPAPAESDEGEAYKGSLTAFRGSYAASVVPTVDPDAAVVETDEGDEPNEIVFEVYEDDDSHNGQITISYDPTVLTVGNIENVEKNAFISAVSVHVDEVDDKGIITIAYANKGSTELPMADLRDTSEEGDDYIDLNSPIVTIHFTAVGCGESECEVITLERNNELNLDESEVFEVSGLDHDWDDPTWTWTETEDGYTATAAFVCKNNEEHTKTLTATVTSEIVGTEKVYTATVTLEGKTYTGTKSVSIGVTVSFDPCIENVEPETIVIPAGGSVETLPTPTRTDGWVFVGWYTAPAARYLDAGQGTQVTTTTTFSENTTVYAHWRLPGDMNGDAQVNFKDLTRLQRYLKYHDVDVVLPNLDVNGDGTSNFKDLTRLQRYLKYHDVDIF